MVEITANANADEWHEFLQTQGDATLYHTPQWKAFLEKTFGYKPRYLFATDESGQLIGMLPLFEIKSRLTGNRLCSVPFSHYCGPIGNAEVIYELLNSVLEYFVASKMDFIEIRDIVNNDQFGSLNSFSTYILDLSIGIDDLWTNLASNARRGIRKSQKSGVNVFATRNVEDIKAFFELNCITKRNLGVPAHPWKFFKNLFECLGNDVQLFVAKFHGEVIGGGIREYYGSKVLAGYSGSDKAYAKYYPINAINWASIQDACQKGFNSYDLGRVSYDNRGLEFFKSRWGTVEMKLFYSYFPRSPATLSGNRSCLTYKVATKATKKMPMPLHRVFSDCVFRHFG